MNPDKNVRVATSSDTDSIGALLHEFNTEFNEPTPSPEKLSERFKMLIESGDTAVLLGGDGPDGIAVMRFYPAIWSEGLECYLAELYVKPDKREHGLGRALIVGAMELARGKGADYIYLGTSEADDHARNLYESVGFSNRESGPDGPIMYIYEREL